MTEKSTFQVTYRAESPLRNPVRMFKEMLHDLRVGRELAWRLFVRNISARYRQTLLGYFWAIFPPLATTGIWLFLTREQVVKVDVGEISYPVFLITGTIIWQTFADAIQIPIRVVSESKSMLAKINFPREALPMTAFAECWFNVGVRLIVLISAFIYLGFVPEKTFLLAFVGVMAIILLGLLIGMFLSPFALLYEDVGNGLVLVVQVWMYSTPVIYAVKDDGPSAFLNSINPIMPLLVQTRDWIISGNSTYLGSAMAVFVGTLVGLAVVFVLYKLALPRAIERLSS